MKGIQSRKQPSARRADSEHALFDTIEGRMQRFLLHKPHLARIVNISRLTLIVSRFSFVLACLWTAFKRLGKVQAPREVLVLAKKTLEKDHPETFRGWHPYKAYEKRACLWPGACKTGILPVLCRRYTVASASR